MASVVEGILVTGQSLAEGGVGDDEVSGVHTPAYPETVFMLPPVAVARGTITSSPSLVPLVESARVSIGHSLTATIAAERRATIPDYQLIFSGQAWGGKAYRDITAGAETRVFERLVDQVRSIGELRPTVTYLGVVCIHGEQDGLDNNRTYAENIGTLQEDISRSVRELTDTSETVPMYICQTNTASGYAPRKGILDDTFPTPLAQLEAHETNPRITLVCPKYHLSYFDHAHLTNAATRLLGEYYAQAFQAARRGESWSALRPVSVVGLANRVVVRFTGNQGPLALDTDLIQSAPDSGFAFHDGADNEIVSVALTGDAEVTITLSGEIAEGAILSYAYHNGSGGKQAQIAGLGDRGNLRDSSPARSIHDARPLYNWCVAFRKDVLLA